LRLTVKTELVTSFIFDYHKYIFPLQMWWKFFFLLWSWNSFVWAAFFTFSVKLNGLFKLISTTSLTCNNLSYNVCCDQFKWNSKSCSHLITIKKLDTINAKVNFCFSLSFSLCGCMCACMCEFVFVSEWVCVCVKLGVLVYV